MEREEAAWKKVATVAFLLLEVITVTTQLIRALHRRFRAHLTSYGWRCLLSMALGMWIAEGKKVLAALTYLVSLGALSRFFNGEGWPSQAIREWRRQLSQELIEEWYGGRGRPPLFYLILDGTVLAKRGKQLPKVGWHYDSRIDDLRWGQKLILAVLRVGELALPWTGGPTSTEIAVPKRTSASPPSRRSS